MFKFDAIVLLSDALLSERLISTRFACLMDREKCVYNN